LIAAGIFDIGTKAAASGIHFFDPAYSERIAISLDIKQCRFFDVRVGLLSFLQYDFGIGGVPSYVCGHEVYTNRRLLLPNGLTCIFGELCSKTPILMRQCKALLTRKRRAKVCGIAQQSKAERIFEELRAIEL
jgi:hypothetical protein